MFPDSQVLLSYDLFADMLIYYFETFIFLKRLLCIISVIYNEILVVENIAEEWNVIHNMCIIT